MTQRCSGLKQETFLAHTIFVDQGFKDGVVNWAGWLRVSDESAVKM